MKRHPLALAAIIVLAGATSGWAQTANAPSPSAGPGGPTAAAPAPSGGSVAPETGSTLPNPGTPQIGPATPVEQEQQKKSDADMMICKGC